MARGAEDYLRMGDLCMPWLRYGGKLMDLGIWKKIGVEMRSEKNSLSGHVNFFPKVRQKITGLGICNQFGMDLAVPNIWLFGFLGEKRIMAGTHWSIPETLNHKK